MRFAKLPYVFAALIIGTAFMSLAPTAAAQTAGNMEITVSASGESVKPLQAPLQFSGQAKLVADQVGQSNLIGIPVKFTATGPAWASVIVSPANAVFVLPQQPQAQATATVPITVTVTATADAPAFTAANIEITGVTTPAQGSTAITGKGVFPITADFYSILDVQLPESIRVERPQTAVNFPLKVTNFGNANTKVTFTLDQIAEGFQTTPPIPVTLQSKQAGGNQITADVILTVQTPYKNGYMNQVGTMSYKITSAYALDPKKIGDSSQVSVLVTTRGFYVPGPSPILFVGLLGVAALLFRRRDA